VAALGSNHKPKYIPDSNLNGPVRRAKIAQIFAEDYAGTYFNSIPRDGTCTTGLNDEGELGSLDSCARPEALIDWPQL